MEGKASKVFLALCALLWAVSLAAADNGGTFGPGGTTYSGLQLPLASGPAEAAIVNPPPGLTVFNTTTQRLEYYNGTAWVGQANATGTFTLGNTAIGDGKGGLRDSGFQQFPMVRSTVDPTASDDFYRDGLDTGSIWINQTSGKWFTCVSCRVANAAIWVAQLAQVFHSYESPAWVFTSITQGQTLFLAPFGQGNGVNANTENPVLFSGSIIAMLVQLAAAPGAGNQIVFTVFVGPLLAPVLTPVTCTIADTNKSCYVTFDATVAPLTVGGAWTVQAVASNPMTPTSTSSIAIGIQH